MIGFERWWDVALVWGGGWAPLFVGTILSVVIAGGVLLLRPRAGAVTVYVVAMLWVLSALLLCYSVWKVDSMLFSGGGYLHLNPATLKENQQVVVVACIQMAVCLICANAVTSVVLVVGRPDPARKSS